MYYNGQDTEYGSFTGHNIYNMIQYVIYVMLLLLSLTMVDSQCFKKDFIKIESKTFVGEVMLTDGPMTVQECLRLCRQYIPCLLVSMRWIEPDRNIGYCNLTGWVQFGDRINATDNSLFGKFVI